MHTASTSVHVIRSAVINWSQYRPIRFCEWNSLAGHAPDKVPYTPRHFRKNYFNMNLLTSFREGEMRQTTRLDTLNHTTRHWARPWSSSIQRNFVTTDPRATKYETMTSRYLVQPSTGDRPVCAQVNTAQKNVIHHRLQSMNLAQLEKNNSFGVLVIFIRRGRPSAKTLPAQNNIANDLETLPYTEQDSNQESQCLRGPIARRPLYSINISSTTVYRSRDSSVGIANGYGLDDQGSGSSKSR
jgi:hypothetical protein